MRCALALVCLLFAAPAHAAALTIRDAMPPEPPVPGELRINFEFVDVTEPSPWAAKSLTGPHPITNDGWLQFSGIYWHNVSSPPVWTWKVGMGVSVAEPGFLWRGTNDGHAIVDVAEFVAAGDTAIVMRLDTDEWNGDFHIITFESPNLGVVTRTFVRTPEPASVALLALCPLALRRRRRRN
jgi:hypothetical protein